MSHREMEVESIERAYEKVTGEKTVADTVRNGMKAKKAFKKYGNL